MTSLPPTPNTRKWCISWGWLLSAVKLFPFGHHHNIYLCTAACFWILTQWCKYSLIWVTVPGDGFLFYFFYFLYKLVSEQPFSYLSDSWFPPQRPPQSYVRLQRVFGKLETVNLFWCSHVGKPDIWAPFQHLPGSFESELSFLCRLCGVTVLCVCQYCWHDWHAVACWQLALWSLAFPPSAVLLLRNCRRPSPPDSVVCLAPGLRATVSGTF